jgi:hypothetical protein
MNAQSNNTWEAGLTRRQITQVENKFRNAPPRLGMLEDIARSRSGEEVVGLFENGRMFIRVATMTSRVRIAD